MDKGPIVNGKYIDELGNYYIAPFCIEGISFHSVEQYFQWRKSADECYKKKVLAEPSPSKCWRLGRKAPALVENWEEIKEDVMFRGAVAKFVQNNRLRELLLSIDPDDITFCEGNGRDAWDIANENILKRVHALFIEMDNT